MCDRKNSEDDGEKIILDFCEPDPETNLPFKIVNLDSLRVDLKCDQDTQSAKTELKCNQDFQSAKDALKCNQDSQDTNRSSSYSVMQKL